MVFADVFCMELDDSESLREETVLKKCNDFLRDSCRLRNLARLKTSGSSKSGRINQLAASKESLVRAEQKRAKDYSKTEGIEETEIQRRKQAAECLCCAWPADRKGAHRVKDCHRPIKLDKGTACYPRGKKYIRQDFSEVDPESSIGSDADKKT
jgi:hypothetical protein